MAAKLFVGGLSWDTTDATLSAFFAQVGQVTSATVITDRFTGRSKGFGFVEMASDEEAKNAITKLNGQSLDGRTIAVSEARPQQPRENNFSGGGGRQGGFNRGGGFRPDRGGQRGGGDRGGHRNSY